MKMAQTIMMSMSLENVFGPNGLTYNPGAREEVRLFKFPDGVVRAFRYLSSEWSLFDMYLLTSRPGTREELIHDIYVFTVNLQNRGDNIGFEHRLRVSARQAFVDLPLRKVLIQSLPANDSRNEHYRRKAI